MNHIDPFADINIDPNMITMPDQAQHSHDQHSAQARPPPKRRNRKAVSCVSCREKKIKCDRVVPCNQCVKRGEQHLCRIEQKPRVNNDGSTRSQDASASAHSAGPYAQQSMNRQTSPGSSAYSQFSAAIASANYQLNNAEASGSPPPAEVEAIKARLAQVEALLAGQIPLSSASGLSPISPPSANNWNNYRPSNPRDNFQISPAFSTGTSSHSPLNSSHRSHSNTNSSHHSSVSPNGAVLDTDESDDDDATPDSSPRAESRRVSPVNHLKTHDMPISRKEMDSDTEDAAVVLERLAMSGGPQPRWDTVQCPTQNQASTKASQSCLSQDEVATGQKFEQCLSRDKEVGLMSEETGQKFEQCLQKDKEVGIMSIECPSAAAANQGPAFVVTAPVTDAVPLPGKTSRNGEPTGMVLPPLNGNESLSSSDADISGFPPCACRSPDEGQAGHEHEENPCAPGSNDQASLKACLMKNQPLSTEPAPITVPCRLACENKGLLRLKSGPETLFGWGMGWAWSAADVLLQKEQLKAKEEGREFVANQRTEREMVLRAVCESLPSKEIANQLIEVYESRVRYLGGHVVHIPCLKREMEAFYALDSVEKRARVVNHVDPGWLGLFLSILALGLRFYPCWPKAGWKPVNHLFDGKTIHAWHSAAKTCLVLAGYLNSTSMSVIQAILLLYLYNSVSGATSGGESDAGTTSTALLRIAITNAQEMGLHRLGDLDKQPTPNEPSSKVIRREIAKRIWWALVFRDWSAAGTGCSKDYVIRAEYFNTPLPGNYNDEDLMVSPLPAPRPREEFTEMSYVLSNIDFGMVVKEDVDVRARRELHAATNGGDKRLTCAESRKLDMMYRAVLENAPSFFKVGSEIGRVTCIEVQRWLLQQAVFSKLLRIHRPNLSSRKESRTNCVLLARSILDMQKKIRARCTVIDRLWVNLMQSFSAAIVLALHLLHTRQTLEHRLSVRSEITEAIRALKQVDGNNCAAKKCIRVIEALLEEEEERWQAGSAALAKKEDATASPTELSKQKRKRQVDMDVDESEGSASSGRRKHLLSLAQRVALAARGDANEAGRGGKGQNGAVAEPSDKSKRQATVAAVQASATPNPSTLIAELQANNRNANGASAFNVNGVPALKDDASRIRMNAMTLPVEGFNMNNLRSDDVPFPEMMPSAVYHHNNFDFNSLANADPSQRIAAPNGVDLMLNNPITPPDGQGFDLAAFLDQCENSPGSSADGSLSSAHDVRSASISSEHSGLEDRNSGSLFANSSASDITDNTSIHSFGEGMLTQEAIQKQQQQLHRGVASPAAQQTSTQASSPASLLRAEPSTDMDSFWNWIITQGANGITSNPDSATPAVPATLVQTQPIVQDQSNVQTSQNLNNTFGFSGYSSTPQSVASQPMSAANTTMPTFPMPAAKDLSTVSETNLTSMPISGEVASVGTPSAGFALDSFLGAPLYDFTDFANAWTASNPTAPAMQGTSLGPISDP